MRACVAYPPGAGPSFHEVGSGIKSERARREFLAQRGWLGPAPRALNLGKQGGIDPIKDPRMRSPGEGPSGLMLRRQPEVLLRMDPELWQIVDEYRLGYRLEPDPGELEELSAFHVECLAIVRSAHGRERERRMKEKKK